MTLTSIVLRTPAAVVLLLSAAATLYAEWPADTEPMGLMGCRWFRFHGMWETGDVSFDEEENTNAACLTVAAASIMNFQRWPRVSYFDALYARCRERGDNVPVAHTWRFDLINGPGGPNANCATDDPAQRALPGTPSWTGVSEMQKLVYVIERAYGHDHECFRTRSSECEGLGDYPVHHLMRNRFGYPHAASLSIRNTEARKTTIRDISAGNPVIAVKCQHVFPLDGYRVDPVTGEGLFHACDYVSAEESTGWFTWKQLVTTGLVRVIAGLSPDITVLPKPGQTKVAYWFGDDYLPQTSHTRRKGFVRIESPAGQPIGPLDVVVTIRQHDSTGSAGTRQLALSKGMAAGARLRVPARGTFALDIEEACVVAVVLRNNGATRMRLRMTLHDFAGSHDLEAWEEKRLYGAP